MVNKNFSWKEVDSISIKEYFHDKNGKILGSVVEFNDYTYKALYETRLLGIYIDIFCAKKAVEDENSKVTSL